jgi:predicted lipoprotein with Yx(FWY)xxD motif
MSPLRVSSAGIAAALLGSVLALPVLAQPKAAGGALVDPNGMTLDGKKQWAAKGWPLYYWAKDTKPGDKTGDGVGEAWKIAKP